MDDWVAMCVCVGVGAGAGTRLQESLGIGTLTTVNREEGLFNKTCRHTMCLGPPSTRVPSYGIWGYL